MEPLREIKPGGGKTDSVSVADLDGNLRGWLLTQAEPHDLTILLAHADDGVIWGQVVDNALLTSHKIFDDSTSPELRLETLQQARLFGEQAELLLWRTAKGWQARLVKDISAGEHYDQSQLLWGNRYVNSRAGFTLVEEGQQGLRHAPPVVAPKSKFDDKRHPLYLCVRHYLKTDKETGIVDVALSRLVEVDYEPRAVKKEVAS